MRPLAIAAAVMSLLTLTACTDAGRVYRHTALHFALEIPPGWSAVENHLGSELYLSPPGEAAALRYISVGVNPASSGGRPRQLADYTAFREVQMRRFASDYKVLEQRRLTLAGGDAERRVVSAKLGSQRSIFLIYYLLTDGVGYTLSAALAPGYERSAMRSAERVLLSFSSG